MSARGQGLQGRKVLVKLIDGTKIVDIFKDNTSKHIILAEHGRVRRDQIKKITPWIETQYVWAAPAHGNKIDTQQAKAFPNLCPMDGAWADGKFQTCRQALNKDGVCPTHRKVRFTSHEHLHTNDDQPQPHLRKAPPRKIRGKTVPKMMHRKSVLGW